MREIFCTNCITKYDNLSRENEWSILLNRNQWRPREWSLLHQFDLQHSSNAHFDQVLEKSSKSIKDPTESSAQAWTSTTIPSHHLLDFHAEFHQPLPLLFDGHYSCANRSKIVPCPPRYRGPTRWPWCPGSTMSWSGSMSCIPSTTRSACGRYDWLGRRWTGHPRHGLLQSCHPTARRPPALCTGGKVGWCMLCQTRFRV